MRTILVVDDVSANRKMLKAMLGGLYNVREAASGEEALEILQKEYKTFSAVLLDIVMPGADGYEVLSEIRRSNLFSHLPVIMITAHEDPAARVKSVELGANDFIMKPYKPEVVKHCLESSIAISEATVVKLRREERKQYRASIGRGYKFSIAMVLSCVVALCVALTFEHFSVRRELRTTCENVTADFTQIFDNYKHTYELLELLMLQKIESGASTTEIEAFLKGMDSTLLAIEGADYDGVYMYYAGRYLYSWDTPYSAYESTGYDATKRPWYIGAVEAQGELFFSTPYPSYANDYMLATISRLQEDGVTVIAYDIKLGAINEFVDKLNLYKGSLALLCDNEGNIIGSTEHLYLGGNYLLSDEELEHAVQVARSEYAPNGENNEFALESVQAQQEFVKAKRYFLSEMLSREGAVCYSLSSFSFGYSYSNDSFTCFVISPITRMLPTIIVLFAATAAVFVVLSIFVEKMLRNSRQILSDALTGLNNRRAFVKYCDSHLTHHSDEKLGLLMLDLNHFKRINDLYGHTVGDKALQDASTVLKSACGISQDNFFLCRYGGDEFLLAARVENKETLDRMREIIAQGFKQKNETSMTAYLLEASMGAACGVCKDKKSVEMLLRRADQAMYNEKRFIERT